MIYFNNDYSEGCHEKILQALIASNLEQNPGYGMDSHCAAAADQIRSLCGNPNLGVHFLVGGTQTNVTVIDAALRGHQAPICAVTGHINVHETGAVEDSGHKVLPLPSEDGKITAAQVEALAHAHYSDGGREHTIQPKMVYISQPTELGTLYTLAELEEIHKVCKQYGLYLFVDGARLGYGMAAKGNDVFLPDLARLCDAFYIGGTKVGALFGEAVVISNPALNEDFRYYIKQHGGMLAKGRLLGIQFEALMSNGLYDALGAYADGLADEIRTCLDDLGVSYLVPGVTNQIFPIFSNAFLGELEKSIVFNVERVLDADRTAIRFCTSWATKRENVEALCGELKRIHAALGSC